MRILIIASESPPVASGVAHSVDRLVRGLRQRGHEVDTLTSADGPYLVIREVRLSGLGARLLGLAHEIAGSMTWSTFTGRFLPSPTSRWGYCGRSGAMTRVLYTHHSTLEFDAGLLASLGSAYTAAHRVLAQLADHVVVTSEAPPMHSATITIRRFRWCRGCRHRSLSASESQRV